MTWILLTLVLFVFLLLLPFGVAAFWYRRGKHSVLTVRQERKRDPRYFAHSFEALLRKAWAERSGDVLKMSRPEPYVLADETAFPAGAASCSKLVLAWNTDFRAPEGMRFEREIFAARNAWFSAGSCLRAVRAMGDLALTNGVQVARWADADGTLAVYDGCNLGISATSGTAMTLGRNCTFRRLYAPVIHTGSYPGLPQTPSFPREDRIYRMECPQGAPLRLRRVDRDHADEAGVVRASCVAQEHIVVDEGVIVQGSVRSARGVQLADRAVVCGNVFADGDVHLGRNSTILGNVFSQGDIYCEAGCIVGCEGHVSSMVARGRIIFEEDCWIHGYVSNEMGGVSCPMRQDDAVSLPEREAQYLQWPEPLRILTFESADAFAQVNEEGFRHNHHVREVVIPEGVRRIPDSMFFDCRALERVSFPASLQEIGEYAFADCVSLRRLDLHGLAQLRSIGRSGFDGCSSLEEVALPDGLQALGSAVFCNCIRLRRVLGRSLRLQTGSHCFQNCPLDEPGVASASLSQAPANSGESASA